MRIALLTLLCALFTAGCLPDDAMSGDPMPPITFSPESPAFVFDLATIDDDWDATIIVEPLLTDGVFVRDIGFAGLPDGAEADYGLYFARQPDADDPDVIGAQFIIEEDGRNIFEEHMPMVLHPGERLHLIVNLQVHPETVVDGQVYIDIGRDEATRFTVPIRPADPQ